MENLVEVWGENFEQVCQNLGQDTAQYTHLYMDLKYPGLPRGNLSSRQRRNVEPNYNNLRKNVNVSSPLSIIMIFEHSEGLLEPISLKFNLLWEYDERAGNAEQNTLEFWRRERVDFQRHQVHGITRIAFQQWINQANIFHNPDLMWVVHKGEFKFAHLLRLAFDYQLPDGVVSFLDFLENTIPMYLDTYYPLRTERVYEGERRSLREICEELQPRVPQHLVERVFYNNCVQRVGQASINTLFFLSRPE